MSMLNLLIVEGNIKKDTDEIRKHLDLICPFRSKESKDSIVRQVENLSELDTAVYEWNEVKVKRWSKEQSATKYNFSTFHFYQIVDCWFYSLFCIFNFSHFYIFYCSINTFNL